MSDHQIEIKTVIQHGCTLYHWQCSCAEAKRGEPTPDKTSAERGGTRHARDSDSRIDIAKPGIGKGNYVRQNGTPAILLRVISKYTPKPLSELHYRIEDERGTTSERSVYRALAKLIADKLVIRTEDGYLLNSDAK